jgi:hypothetical protein
MHKLQKSYNAEQKSIKFFNHPNDPFNNFWKKNYFQVLPISQNIILNIGFSWNQSFIARSNNFSNEKLLKT